jgi:3-oxoacid CoA-transferase
MRKLTLVGALDTLLTALTKRKEVQNLTGVSNNCGTVDSGLGNVAF